MIVKKKEEERQGPLHRRRASTDGNGSAAEELKVAARVRERRRCRVRRVLDHWFIERGREGEATVEAEVSNDGHGADGFTAFKRGGCLRGEQ
jgi:hypothetical protein